MTKTTWTESKRHLAGKSMSPRILLAKVGLDGHDRGIKVVARGLRDAGFHVIYGGIWQSPEAVAQAALDEDVDWLGLSLLSGAHMTLVPRVVDAMKEIGGEAIPLLLGGIIPEADVPKLTELGVQAVFGPGTSIQDIATFVETHQTNRTESWRQPMCGAITDGPEGQEKDRGTLSRLLSLAAAGTIDINEIPEECYRSSRKVRVVGITGGAGVGKSSVIARLLGDLQQLGLSTAVLACDPESPVTRGALLGDRVRMEPDTRQSRPSRHCQQLIRSLAVPSGRQGIGGQMDAMVGILDAFEFDIVLIESVGAGQGDVAIRVIADTVLVLLQPGTGDAIQWEKAGQLEIADAVVVQKSDMPGAAHMAGELKQHLNLPGCPSTLVLQVSALTGEGFAELREFVVGDIGVEGKFSGECGPS